MTFLVKRWLLFLNEDEIQWRATSIGVNKMDYEKYKSGGYKMWRLGNEEILNRIEENRTILDTILKRRGEYNMNGETEN